MRTGTSIWNKGAWAALALLGLSACGGTDPAPAVITEPARSEALVPTFESLSANIFQGRCVDCHRNKNVKAHGVPVLFESQQQLLQAGLVVPGEPDQSILLQRVTLPVGTRGHMPAGNTALAAGEIDAIRAWIAALGTGGIILTPIGE